MSSNASGDHYAVDADDLEGLVVLQVQADNDRARVTLSPHQAQSLAEQLLAAAGQVR